MSREEITYVTNFANALLEEIRTYADVKDTAFKNRKKSDVKTSTLKKGASLSASLMVLNTVEDMGKTIDRRMSEKGHSQYWEAISEIGGQKYGLLKRPSLTTRLIDILSAKGEQYAELVKTLTTLNDAASQSETSYSPLAPILAAVISAKAQDPNDDKVESALAPYVLAFINKGMVGPQKASRQILVDQAVELAQTLCEEGTEESTKAKIEAYLHDLALYSKLYVNDFKDSSAAASFNPRSNNQLQYISDRGRRLPVFRNLANTPALETYNPDNSLRISLFYMIKSNIENKEDGRYVWNALKAYSDELDKGEEPIGDDERALRIAVYGIIIARYSGLTTVNPEASAQLLESLADVYGEIKSSMGEKEFKDIVDSVRASTIEQLKQVKAELATGYDHFDDPTISETYDVIKAALEGLETESVAAEEPVPVRYVELAPEDDEKPSREELLRRIEELEQKLKKKNERPPKTAEQLAAEREADFRRRVLLRIGEKLYDAGMGKDSIGMLKIDYDKNGTKNRRGPVYIKVDQNVAMDVFGSLTKKDGRDDERYVVPEETTDILKKTETLTAPTGKITKAKTTFAAEGILKDVFSPKDDAEPKPPVEAE